MMELDLKDLGKCREYMQKFGGSPTPWGAGISPQGETVIIWFYHDHLSVHTYQKNGRERVNVLWSDGTTEEYYD